MEFASDEKTRAAEGLCAEFLEHVLYDEEPLFISDEANVFDVSTLEPAKLTKRCFEYYGKSVTLADLKLPLWQLVTRLSEGREPEPLKP
jgi:hypothetical protein